MRIFGAYIRDKMDGLRRHDVRVRFIGMRHRVPDRLRGPDGDARARDPRLPRARADHRHRLRRAQRADTRGPRALGARSSAGRSTRRRSARRRSAAALDTAALPDPDLIVRTSGELPGLELPALAGGLCRICLRPGRLARLHRRGAGRGWSMTSASASGASATSRPPRSPRVPDQRRAPPSQKASAGRKLPAGKPRRLTIAGRRRRTTAGSSAATMPRRTSRAAIAPSEPRVAPSSTLSATPRPRRGKDGDEDALGAGLDGNRPVHRLHQLGAGAALAGDERRGGRPSRRRGGGRRPRGCGRGRGGRPCGPWRRRGRGRWWRSSGPSSRRCPSRGWRRRSSPRRRRGRPSGPGGRSRRTRARRRGGGSG